MTEPDMGWLRKRKELSGSPFLPLTGDSGEVVVRFKGLPVLTDSNFKESDGSPKKEYRFQVDYWDPNNGGESEERTITENSDSFLACVSEITNDGLDWSKLVEILWTKDKAKKSGRIFKNFAWACIDAEKAGQFKQAALGDS